MQASFDQRVFEKVRTSELFTSYQNAFREATGLPLRALNIDDDWCLNEHLKNQSPFCETMNRCQIACSACVDVNVKLSKQAQVNGASSCKCFAGLTATAVPIKLGKSVIGFLKTGQIFHRLPTEADFEKLTAQLKFTDIDEFTLSLLRETYFQTKVVDPVRYESMVQLLDLFGKQLSDFSHQISLQCEESEPETIAKARHYIHINLSEQLRIPEIAKFAGLSESHFSRFFKEVTKLTVTDYISMARIEWTKKELLRPNQRVSDIAFEVGFQSLSQFNRTFSKLTGLSPTKYKVEHAEQLLKNVSST